MFVGYLVDSVLLGPWPVSHVGLVVLAAEVLHDAPSEDVAQPQKHSRVAKHVGRVFRGNGGVEKQIYGVLCVCARVA